MRMQVSESVNANHWDAKVCSVGGTIFHSTTWADYTAAAYPHIVPQFITLISDDGQVLGIALGFRDCSQYKVLTHFSKRLWFDAIPAVRGLGVTAVLVTVGDLLLVVKGRPEESTERTLPSSQQMKLK